MPNTKKKQTEKRKKSERLVSPAWMSYETKRALPPDMHIKQVWKWVVLVYYCMWHTQYLLVKGVSKQGEEKKVSNLIFDLINTNKLEFNSFLKYNLLIVLILKKMELVTAQQLQCVIICCTGVSSSTFGECLKSWKLLICTSFLKYKCMCFVQNFITLIILFWFEELARNPCTHACLQDACCLLHHDVVQALQDQSIFGQAAEHVQWGESYEGLWEESWMARTPKGAGRLHWDDAEST